MKSILDHLTELHKAYFCNTSPWNTEYVNIAIISHNTSIPVDRWYRHCQDIGRAFNANQGRGQRHTAFDEANYLSTLCKHVFPVHRFLNTVYRNRDQWVEIGGGKKEKGRRVFNAGNTGFTSECICERRRVARGQKSTLSFGLCVDLVNHHGSSVQNTNANLAGAHGWMTPVCITTTACWRLHLFGVCFGCCFLSQYFILNQRAKCK